MTLTDRDKADLLGLLSSLGEPAADARALKLAATDPEAAEYLRQMRSIATALQPLEDKAEPLSARQSALLLNRIYDRTRTNRLGPRDLGVPRRMWRLKYVAMAAAILLVLGPGLWFYNSVGRHTQIGEAVLIPLKSYYGVPVNVSRFRVQSGSTLDTGPQLGGLLLRNGNRIIVKRDSRIDAVSSQEVVLGSGVCFVRATQPIWLTASTARFEVLQGAVQIGTEEGRITCEVFSGAVTAEAGGKRYELWAGTIWTWNVAENTAAEAPLQAKPPAMVQEVESALLNKTW